MPSDKTSQTSLWNPHRGKVKGEMEVEFLPTCGAAQEKQSAAALHCSTPNALPLYFVRGFWPRATTGAIPRTGFQVTPWGFLVSSRECSFLAADGLAFAEDFFRFYEAASHPLLGLLLFSMMLFLLVAGFVSLCSNSILTVNL